MPNLTASALTIYDESDYIALYINDESISVTNFNVLQRKLPNNINDSTNLTKNNASSKWKTTYIFAMETSIKGIAISMLKQIHCYKAEQYSHL